MTLNLDLVKAAAEQFVIRLLPEDRAKVGAFNDKIQILPKDDFTNDRDQLIRILKNDLDFGYPTRLFDAVDESISAMRGIDGRRVVITFTDGDDTASRLGRGDVLERARIEGVMVYGVGLESDYFNGAQRVRTRPDRGLKNACRGDGWGILRSEEDRRARADVHPHRPGTAQSVCARFFTPHPGRESAQT